MGLHNIRRDRNRFSRLNYQLRTLLLGLSALIIMISVLLAVIVFSYVFDIATHPLNAKALVDQWTSLYLESSTAKSSSPASPFDGPARWFAIITLIALAYLLIRIPLLMLQMGTQLLLSCQEDSRNLRSFVREVLQELTTAGHDEEPH